MNYGGLFNPKLEVDLESFVETQSHDFLEPGPEKPGHSVVAICGKHGRKRILKMTNLQVETGEQSAL